MVELEGFDTLILVYDSFNGEVKKCRGVDISLVLWSMKDDSKLWNSAAVVTTWLSSQFELADCQLVSL